MNYKSLTTQRVHIVRWTGPAEVSDLREMLSELDTFRVRLPALAIHVSLVPPGYPPLAPDVRSEILKLTPRLFGVCEAVYNVVEGSGFWASTMRGVFTGLVLASGVRGRVFVEGSLAAAAHDMAGRFDVQPEPLLALARQTGIAA